jgi:electron-transferring-flavoprotein dehydrogenase
MSRESMQYDCVIVGAGPAGLACAIRLKQLAAEKGRETSVCVLEKGSEVGAHILSGAVMDPRALEELFPDWKAKGAPLNAPVSEDRFLILGESSVRRVPNVLLPACFRNHGNYVISLGNLCRWLGQQAESLGVEIFPGFAAAEVLYDQRGAVMGVATGDMGVNRKGEKTDSYQPGMELHAKYTFFAEGCRGSLGRQLQEKFALRIGVDPQVYGIGLKELWEVRPEKHKQGLVVHTAGWPLERDTYGGSFLYHLENNQVAVGFVVGLAYTNPYLSPYEEFQRFKTHPAIRGTFESGKRIGYGSRALTEGGWQSIPELVIPGGVLIGCAAGFMNVPRIKGSHNAILSGIAAAEAAFEAVQAGRAHDRLDAYESTVRSGDIARDLKPVSNVKPLWSRFGTYVGVALGGVDMWLNTLLPGKGLGFTLKHGKADYASLTKAADAKVISYPKPDGVLTFDRLTSVSFSGTNHEENQPVHLKLTDPSIPIRVNLPEWAEPAQRYCPAAVYEIVIDGGNPRFQINAQNCVHCKTCDIKDPSQNITWVCPEGGGGPNYAGM